jgi:hypothetical protein
MVMQDYSVTSSVVSTAREQCASAVANSVA